MIMARLFLVHFWRLFLPLFYMVIVTRLKPILATFRGSWYKSIGLQSKPPIWSKLYRAKVLKCSTEKIKNIGRFLVILVGGVLGRGFFSRKFSLVRDFSTRKLFLNLVRGFCTQKGRTVLVRPFLSLICVSTQVSTRISNVKS